MKVFEFIILSLAVYRLTVLISRDLGPWSLFKHLRSRSRLLRCPACSSVWISAAVNLCYYFLCEKTGTVILIASIFAMSGISMILDRTFTFDHNS